MVDEKELQIISSRKQSAWIAGCPVRVTEVKLCIDPKTNDDYIVIVSKGCTDRKINSYTAEIEYFNGRKEKIGECSDISCAQFTTVQKSEFSGGEYAEVKIKKVNYADGIVWENSSNSYGYIPVEQNIIWQTDPLYKVIKKVTHGKVNAKYYPDEIEGGWRCACGNINAENSQSCGECGCLKTWLSEAFDKDYLKSQIEIVDSGKKPESVKKIQKKQAESRISDKTKMVLIFSTLILLVVMTALSIVYFIPQLRYNAAHKYVAIGEYDKAIEMFEDLGRFKNSRELVSSFTYEKYVNLTGVGELYITNSTAEPWFKITEEGCLEFIDTKYKGSWDHFKIPHVVDGIVVVGLEKNFLLNCSELVSLTLPETICVIGEQAFMNCSSLEKIEFGTRITEIHPRAFANCTALTEITIPDTVVVFGQRMFNNCSTLETVTLGAGINQIQAYTFSNCTSLKTLHIKSPITAIGESAFENCDALSEVICSFGKSEWIAPSLEAGNEALSNAKIKFN